MRFHSLAAVAVLTQALLPVRAFSQPAGAVDTSTGILGLSLEYTSLQDAQSMLGPNPIQDNGGKGATNVKLVCYVGADNTAVILTSSETGPRQAIHGFQVLADTSEADPKSLAPECSPLPALSRATSVAGGFRLGMTPKEAEAVVGKPQERSSGRMIWRREQIGRARRPDPSTPATPAQPWRIHSEVSLRFRDGKVVAISARQHSTQATGQ